LPYDTEKDLVTLNCNQIFLVFFKVLVKEIVAQLWAHSLAVFHFQNFYIILKTKCKYCSISVPAFRAACRKTRY